MYRIEGRRCRSMIRNVRRWAARLAGSAAIGLALAGPVRADPIDFATVALTGDPAPGTATTFAGFVGSPVLDDSGQVAFTARLTGGDSGIWKESPGLGKVVISGDPAPGTPSTFASFPGSPALAQGRTAFLGVLTGGGQGIWKESPGIGKVAVTGDAAPGTATTFSGFRIPAINDAGHTAIAGRLVGGGEGVWKESPALGKVAVTGDPAPGTATTFSLFPSTPAINASDHTAFTATALCGQGVWKESPALGLVACGGTPAPGTSDTFFAVRSFSLNDLDHTALRGFLSGVGQGIWKESPALGLVAVTGDPAPGTATTFSGFDSEPALNDLDHVAFRALLTGGGHGIWAEDPSGVLSLVARSNDTIEVLPGDFRTIRQLLTIPNGFNDSGQLAFRADFFGGSEGIFVASFQTPGQAPVPEPSSVALLGLGLGSLALARRFFLYRGVRKASRGAITPL